MTSPNVRGSETRILRPFVGLSFLEDLVDQSSLTLGDETFYPISNLNIDLDRCSVEAIEINVGVSQAKGEWLRRVQEALTPAGVDSSDVLVRIEVTSNYLKTSEILSNETLESLASRAGVIKICERSGRRSNIFSSTRHGFFLTVSLIRASEIESARFGSPWRKGTILATVTFNFSNQEGSIGFVPLPLTDEVRAREGLHKGTMRYVACDESPLSITDTDGAVKFYVDSLILERLSNQRQGGPISSMIQNQLALDVLSAIIAKASLDDNIRDATMSDPATRSSLIGKIVNALAGSQKNEPQPQLLARQNQLLHEIASNPQKVIAIAEGSTSLLKSTRSLIDSEWR